MDLALRRVTLVYKTCRNSLSSILFFKLIQNKGVNNLFRTTVLRSRWLHIRWTQRAKPLFFSKILTLDRRLKIIKYIKCTKYSKNFKAYRIKCIRVARRMQKQVRANKFAFWAKYAHIEEKWAIRRNLLGDAKYLASRNKKLYVRNKFQFRRLFRLENQSMQPTVFFNYPVYISYKFYKKYLHLGWFDRWSRNRYAKIIRNEYYYLNNLAKYVRRYKSRYKSRSFFTRRRGPRRRRRGRLYGVHRRYFAGPRVQAKWRRSVFFSLIGFHYKSIENPTSTVKFLFTGKKLVLKSSLIDIIEESTLKVHIIIKNTYWKDLVVSKGWNTFRYLLTIDSKRLGTSQLERQINFIPFISFWRYMLIKCYLSSMNLNLNLNFPSYYYWDSRKVPEVKKKGMSFYVYFVQSLFLGY